MDKKAERYERDEKNTKICLNLLSIVAIKGEIQDISKIDQF